MGHATGGLGAADGGHVDDDGWTIRLLEADEGEVVGAAIRAAYGDTYDAPWVYDADEVARRLRAGLLVAAVAESPDGEVVCHAALSRRRADERVVEAGQAVTLPAARGHHLFTRVKAHLAGWAAEAGLYGLFSEATTVHPYSERANVELGAREAGFLLGWVPATVANDAAVGAGGGRHAAALFYLKTNDGHDRPLYAPDRHRAVVGRLVEACGLRGEVAVAGPGAAPADPSVLHVERVEGHGLAVLTVEVPGADLSAAVTRERAALFDAGVDVVYVDLPLARPETEAAGGQLEDHGAAFAGIYPNGRVEGDVLRLQCLHEADDVHAAEITTASDHGRELLAYVLADLARVGVEVAAGPGPGAGEPSASP